MARQALDLELSHQGGESIVLSLLPNIVINGIELATPKSIEDIFSLLRDTHQLIQSTQAPEVKIQLGDQQMRIHPEPIGEGVKTIVYSVEGKQEVLKIPRPTYRGLMSIIYAKKISNEGHILMQKNPRLLVPEGFAFQSLGLYSIEERFDGPTLSEYFTAQGLFFKDRATGEIRMVSGPKRAQILSLPMFKLISQEIESYLQQRRQYPSLLDDIGPSNFILDSYRNQLAFVDLGPASVSTSTRYNQIKNFEDYLNEAVIALNRYIQKGSLTLSQVDKWSTEKIARGNQFNQCAQIFELKVAQ